LTSTSSHSYLELNKDAELVNIVTDTLNMDKKKELIR
jgi:hypothetical protein